MNWIEYRSFFYSQTSVTNFPLRRLFLTLPSKTKKRFLCDSRWDQFTLIVSSYGGMEDSKVSSSSLDLQTHLLFSSLVIIISSISIAQIQSWGLFKCALQKVILKNHVGTHSRSTMVKGRRNWNRTRMTGANKQNGGKNIKIGHFNTNTRETLSEQINISTAG